MVPLDTQVVASDVIVRTVRVDGRSRCPSHVRRVVLPEADQLVGVALLDLEPLAFGVRAGRRAELLVLHHVLARRGEARIDQAMAAKRRA